MGVYVPEFLDDPRTRINNEVAVYYVKDVGRIVKTLTHANGVVVESVDPSCGSDESCPADSFLATITINKNKGAVGPIPANSPLYTAAEGEHEPAQEGDSVQIVCLPFYTNRQLICFDSAVTPTFGDEFRAVPRKYNNVDHYVRLRGERSITLGDMLVGPLHGLQAIRGIPVTVIVVTTPDGGAAPTSIQYYSNVLLSPVPMNSSGDGNASIEISMTGNFAFMAEFYKLD